MRRNVKKTSVIIAVATVVLVMLLVIGTYVFRSGIRFSSVSSSHGEDYKDGRQKSWELLDENDNPVLTIRADRGYILSGQSNFSCEILSKDSGKCYVSIEENIGLSQQEAIEKYRNYDGVSIEVKPGVKCDYADITVTRDGKVEHYLVLGDTDNSVQVTLHADSLTEDKKDLSGMKEEILSMLEWES